MTQALNVVTLAPLSYVQLVDTMEKEGERRFIHHYNAPGYTVGTVTVTGLAATCYSKPYKVTLSGAASVSLGEATGTTPSSGTSFAATFSPAVSAASVTGISVVISG